MVANIERYPFSKSLAPVLVLKHHYIAKRIRELLIGNSRFLIHNSLNQSPYYADITCLLMAEIAEILDLNNKG